MISPVNIGTVPGDGTGDPLRTAMAKLNSGLADAAGVETTRNVKDKFSAKGNGILLAGGAVTAASSALSVPSAHFVAADVGKVISIVGAGTAGASLTTTILARVSGTAVTLATPAVTTVTDAQVVYGTDDTTAIQNALTAVGAAGGGTLYFPEGIYIINGPLQDPGTGTHHNAQLVIPEIPPPNGILIKLQGSKQPMLRYAVDWVAPGSVLWSTLVATSGRVIHCSNSNTPAYSALVDFNSVRVDIESLTIRCVPNPGLSCLDLSGAQTAVLKEVWVDTGHNEYQGPQPTTTTSVGIVGPSSSNVGGGSLKFSQVYVGGFYTGFQVCEHTLLENCVAYSCWRAFYIAAGGHQVTMTNCNAEACKIALAAKDYSVCLACSGLSIESAIAGWWSPPYLLDDNGAMSGSISYLFTNGNDPLPMTNTTNEFAPGGNVWVEQKKLYARSAQALDSTGLTGPSTQSSDTLIVPPASLLVTPTAANWFGANSTIIHRFHVSTPIAVRYANFLVDTASGNICVSLLKIVAGAATVVATSGVIACPAPGGHQIDIGNTLLSGGEYGLMFWCSNTTAKFYHANNGVVMGWASISADGNLSDPTANFSPVSWGSGRFLSFFTLAGNHL